MPIRQVVFSCVHCSLEFREYGCAVTEDDARKAAKKHERLCTKNPKNGRCPSCKYFGPEQHKMFGSFLGCTISRRPVEGQHTCKRWRRRER